MRLSVKSKQMIKFLTDNGYYFVSQEGSHKKYSNGTYTTTVPEHNKDLGIGLLLKILRDTKLRKKELEEWLGR